MCLAINIFKCLFKFKAVLNEPKQRTVKIKQKH